MLGHRHELARFQSDFYRNCLRKTIILLMIATVIMLGLLAAIIYVQVTAKVPEYFATTTTGKIVPMIPVQ